MVEIKKQRIESRCPVCNSPCFLSETKSGNEYSYFCKTGKHRGFVAKEEAIRALFQLEEVEDAIRTEVRKGSNGDDWVASGGAKLRERIERNRSSTQGASRLEQCLGLQQLNLKISYVDIS